MISVIIPTYNEEKNIENCLNSLLNQTLPRKEYEIIVVDGQSKDKTVSIAKKYADKVIQQKSKGVGGARNDGVKLAKYDLIATTDADCIVPKNWLKDIITTFNNKKVVLLTGNIKFIDGTIGSNLFVNLVKFPLSIIYKSKLTIPCMGPNMAFKKKEFLKIGGFKDISILDDFEIYTRFKKIGSCLYNSKLIVNTSARRMNKQGVIKLHYLWTVNTVRLLLKYPVKKTNYAKLNYD